MNKLATSQGETETAGGGGFLTHIPTILWQRRLLVVIPFLLTLTGAIAAALLLPPVYQSSALMLVQSPQLPQNVTGTDTGEIVDRRVARIRQQITSRLDLLALIEKYDLYASQRASKPLSEVVDTMREAITLEPSNDGGTSAAGTQTIAFRVSFQYHEPQPAQAIAQNLMERILELDTTDSAKQVSNTVQFLSDQARSLQRQIGEVEQKIGAINSQYGSILGNSGIVMGGNSGSYDVQIAQLQRENSMLTAQKQTSETADTRAPGVAAAESALAAARAIYSETHPDVVIAKRKLAEAMALAKTQAAKTPTNTIDQQIAFNNSQISALRAAKQREMGQMNETLNAQARAPAIQQQLTELQQRLSGLNDQYKTVSDHLMTARANERAENQQMGERLLVADPPVVPDRPTSPNRLLLIGIGLGGGLGLGVVMALAFEMLLGPVRDPAQLMAIVGEAPLGIVPVIQATTKRRKWSWAFWKRRRTPTNLSAAE